MLAVGADAVEGIEGFRSLRLVEALLNQLGIAQYGGKRSSELVAHVGHELVLVLAGDLQLSKRLAQLVEQSRVFNGDDGLAGKTLDKLDLLFREWPHLLPVDDDSPS